MLSKNLARKLVVSCITLSIALSQSGCLLGFAWPVLWIPAIGTGVVGFAVLDGRPRRHLNPDMPDESVTYVKKSVDSDNKGINPEKKLVPGSPPILGAGHFVGGTLLLNLAFVLDTKGPERSDILNPLPLSTEIANQAHVSLRDIKSFNCHLDEVRQVGAELVQDIQKQLNRKNEFFRYESMEEFSRDPEVDRLSRKYGFESGEDFVASFSSRKLPNRNVKAFAEKVNLPEGVSKLLLHYGLGAEIEE